MGSAEPKKEIRNSMKRLGKEKTLGITKKGIKGIFERGTGRKIEGYQWVFLMFLM
jgi:hypothetical protein